MTKVKQVIKVDDIDHEIEDALNNMIDMQIQVDMPPPVELEGLEQDDIDHIEQQKRQQEEDRLKELELARIEADLEAKVLGDGKLTFLSFQIFF